MTKEELNELLHTDENFRIERTASNSNVDKLTVFEVVITDANATAIERTYDELRTKLAQHDNNFKIRIKSLIFNINDDYYSARELQLRMNSARTPYVILWYIFLNRLLSLVG